MADCQYNPNMVINSIFPVGLSGVTIHRSPFLLFTSLFSHSFLQVFDAFRARLQESNSKVNLHALESLQKIIHSLKDNLSQVVNILVPAIVDNHLNSKNNAVYSAAVGTLNALVANLGACLSLHARVRGNIGGHSGFIMHFFFFHLR